MAQVGKETLLKAVDYHGGLVQKRRVRLARPGAIDG